jgi:ribonucleoside-triphosphate reductase
MTPTSRAQIITRRTYSRPIDEANGVFETWEQTVDRVIEHQRWLWRRAKGRDLTARNQSELEELRLILLKRQGSVAGRTLWLGGTDVAKRREASQFNCSYENAESVHDVVDALWLLLQGCGVGATPKVGTLNGFARPIGQIKVVRSTRSAKGGDEDNKETWNSDTKTWTIRIGDSAEAWAKSIGKLLAGKYPAEVLVLDFGELRPAGLRLAGYGWISSGDAAIAVAFERIAEILNKRAGMLLTFHDIHDILNWLGTILSSRRSSEIILHPYGELGWRYFAEFKKDWFLHNNDHRQQSNNSLVFWSRPSKAQLTEIFEMMVAAGGSEPGFINGEAATRRAPWFAGANPCVEILLGNKSFCNLVELCLMAFRQNPAGLRRAIQVLARANYRQTCVDLRDGILQSAWHENNEFLRLCGVGITGVTGRPDLGEYDYRQLRNLATAGAYSMAEELGLPLPKNVTTLKPSGTLSKHMGTVEFGEVPEGGHKPLGRYIFNHVKFSTFDPLVPKLREAGYNVFASPNPTDVDTVIAALPTSYDTVNFDVVDGMEINSETAIKQLERYKMLMDNYVDHNCSITVSYDPTEVKDIVDWLYYNWDSYVGVAWMFRNDPTKTAKDLGYDYLPQQVVTKDQYDEYVKDLKEITLSDDIGQNLVDEECENGYCPVR